MNTEENDIEAEDDRRDPRLSLIFGHYGEEHQRWKLVEECGELLAELGRFKNGDRTNVADLVHEMADVIVVARQLFEIERSNVWPNNVDECAHFLTERVGNVVADIFDSDSASFYAGVCEDWVFALAEFLEAEPMLYRAIDMKIERQLERIAREAQESGK